MYAIRTIARNPHKVWRLVVVRIKAAGGPGEERRRSREEHEMSEDCRICDYERQPPPGGWFFQTEHWSVGRHPTMQVPGWVACQLRRHAPGLADMTAEELASMGPTLATVARAITEHTDAERVYFVSFGENHRHVHVVLIPRGPNVAAEHRSSALHVNSKLYADPVAAEQTEQRLRVALAGLATSG